MSGNTSYHSVQNFLSSSLLSKNIKIKIYKTIILPVVFYESENWSLTMREECRLRVFETRVLRRIFVSKRDNITGECRRLHNEELNDLHSSPNIIWVIKSRRVTWVGYVACMGREVCTGFWWGNLGETDHLEDPGIDGWIILHWVFRKWNEGGMDSIDLAQDRDRWQALVNAVLNLQDP